MQTALHTGIHRCSHDDQTMYATKGSLLSSCSCGHGAWEFLAPDNMSHPVSLLIGAGLIHATDIEEIPEEGSVMNFRGFQMPPGAYRVTKLDTMGWRGKEEMHVDVEKVGDIDPQLPIYPTVLLTC